MAVKDSWGLLPTGVGGVGLYGHLYAVLQFFKAFGGDVFSGLQALHCSGVTIGGADRDVAYRSALVGLNDVDKLPARCAESPRWG